MVSWNIVSESQIIMSRKISNVGNEITERFLEQLIMKVGMGFLKGALFSLHLIYFLVAVFGWWSQQEFNLPTG